MSGILECTEQQLAEGDTFLLRCSISVINSLHLYVARELQLPLVAV